MLEKDRPLVFFTCPKCSHQHHHLVCLNCDQSRWFTLEDDAAMCGCGFPVKHVACPACRTYVTHKFFFALDSREAEKEHMARAPTMLSEAASTTLGCLMLLGLAIAGWYGFSFFFCSPQPDPPIVRAQPRHAATTPRPRPVPATTAPRPRLSPDYNRFCRAAFEDLKFLDVMYEVTQRPTYRPTPANCNKMTHVVNKRLDVRWLRRVATPTYQPGEHPVANAARDVAVGGVEIVLAFACDGRRGLVKKHGKPIIQAYRKQYRRSVKTLREICLREIR